MTKVLIVDDVEQNLYLLQMLLQGHGYTVASACNGAQALESARHAPPELVVTDILMPVMDGFTLCREWKSDPQLKQIPFVFCTATYTDPKDKKFALDLGADRFITKPIEPEEMLKTLEDVMAEHQAGRLVPRMPVAGDMVHFKQYNQVLIHKLEDKMAQLEEAGRQLSQCIKDQERLIRERTAELAAANQDLQTFAFAVSHDLRAPLRAIDGYSQILAAAWRDKFDDKARSCLDNVQSEVQRMGRLIEALLQLSRATRGELRREPVNLSQLALEIEGDLRREQPSRQVDFRVAPGLLTQGDPALLRSVLRNLLGNAWKFTAKLPEARIEFGQAGQEDKAAYFVSDNGAGFDMESAGKLFAPFHRLHDQADFPGTGIGLATVQQVIRRHGGKVWARSAAGKGATFYFTLQAGG